MLIPPPCKNLDRFPCEVILVISLFINDRPLRIKNSGHFMIVLYQYSTDLVYRMIIPNLVNEKSLAQ